MRLLNESSTLGGECGGQVVAADHWQGRDQDQHDHIPGKHGHVVNHVPDSDGIPGTEIRYTVVTHPGLVVDHDARVERLHGHWLVVDLDCS